MNVLIFKAGQKNLTAKAALKNIKADVSSHYNSIQLISANVERRLEHVKAKLDDGAQKTQKIRQMKRELAMIRATYPPNKVCVTVVLETD